MGRNQGKLVFWKLLQRKPAPVFWRGAQKGKLKEPSRQESEGRRDVPGSRSLAVVSLGDGGVGGADRGQSGGQEEHCEGTGSHEDEGGRA